MVARRHQTAASASVTRAILGRVATRNVTTKGRVSTAFVSVMISIKAASVKSLVAPENQTAPPMGNVILIYISAHVLQVGKYEPHHEKNSLQGF